MVGKIAKKAVTESIWKLISTFIGQAGGLIFIVIIARLLKPEGFGIYNLALAIVLIFITFADAGFNRAVLRYVSYSLGRKDKREASSYLRYLFRTKFALLIVLAAILIALSYPLSFFVFKKPDLFLPLIIVSFYLIAISLESFFAHLFYALKKVKFLTIKQVIFQLLRISLVLLVFAVLTKVNLLIGLLIILIISNFVALFVLLFFLKRTSGFLFEKSSKSIDKKRVFKFIKYLTIAGLTAPIFGYIDTLMLGALLPSEYVGYYSAAFGLVMAASGLLLVSTILLPIFTQLKKSQLRDAFDRVFRYVCMVTIPMVFGAMVLGKYFLRLIYGYEYLPAQLPFNFLTFLIFSTIITSILVSLFSAREKPQYFIKILVISTILNVVLNYVLIKSFLSFSLLWGMTGAAIATLTSRVVYLVSLGFTSNRRLHVRFKPSSIFKPLVSSIVMFAVLFSINLAVVEMTLILGAIEVILGVLIYTALMLLIRGIQKQDIELFFSILPERLPFRKVISS